MTEDICEDCYHPNDLHHAPEWPHWCSICGDNNENGVCNLGPIAMRQINAR